MYPLAPARAVLAYAPSIARLSKYMGLFPGSEISEALLKSKFYLLFLLLFASRLALADALMLSEAVKESAIIQYYVD